MHGLKWSHNALGAAVGRAVLQRLVEGGLIDRSADLGERIRKDLSVALDGAPSVGDVRGIGMLIGVELVRDRETKDPFPRGEHVTERVLAAARDAGLLLYASTGHVDGTNGDLVMLGPPFILTDDDAVTLVELTAEAIRSVR